MGLKKFIRRLLNISAFTFGLILVAVFSLLIAVQTPKVQTFLAKKAVSIIDNKLGGNIEFSSIQIHPFDALILKDVVILDKQPFVMSGATPIDTIFRAKDIVATFSIKGLFHKEGIHIQRAYVSDAIFNLAIEPGSTNIQRFLNLTQKEDKKEPGDVFDANSIEVQGLRFKMINYKNQIRDKQEGSYKPHVKGTINWDDLDANIIKLKGRNLKMSQGYMSGELISAELREKSGYHVSDFEGKAKVGHGKTSIKDILFSDNWSLAHIPSLEFSYANSAAWSDFINAVRMNGELENSRVDLRSISYFAPALKGRSMIANISSAAVEGYVSDLHFKRLKFVDELSGIGGNVKGSITGLPDSQGMLTDLQNVELSFTTAGIGKFIKGWAPNSTLDLSKYAPGQTFTFKGKGNGPLNRMAINGDINSGVGSVSADLDIRNLIDPDRAIQIGTILNARNLNIGKIAGIDAVGECSLKTSLSATMTPGSPSVKIDSVVVSKANVLGYEYTGIMATGNLDNSAFDGKVICSDPNLNFLFQGILNFSRDAKNAIYKFNAVLGYADLNALNIDKRGTSKLSGRVNANYMRVQKGDLTGTIDVLDLNFEDNQGRHDVGNISISSHQNDDVYRINLASRFAEGRYIGSKSFTNIVKDIQEVTLRKEIPALYTKNSKVTETGEYEISLNFNDSRDILSLINPQLFIADSTFVHLKMAKDGDMSGIVRSQRIALGSKYLKDVNLSLNNYDSSLNALLQSNELSIGGLVLKDDRINFHADDNALGLSYTFDNGTELENKGELFLSGVLGRSPKDSLMLTAQTLPSNIYYEGDGWSIKPASVSMVGSNIKIDNLTAQMDDQWITVNGGISPTKTDTLSLKMQKFNIGLVNTLLKDKYNIQGIASGTALLTSPTKEALGLVANIKSDSTYFAGQRVGTLHVASSFDDGKIHLIARNNLDMVQNLNLTADFFPKRKYVDANISLNELNAAYAFPFLSSIFSELGGKVDGILKAQGPLNNLELESDGARFNNLEATVDFTKVKYLANGPIRINSEGLHFDNVDVHDGEGGFGTLSGALTYDHLRDLGTDIHLHFDRMKVLNLNEADNDTFYGQIYATGNCDITGPLNAILLSADASTTKEGSLHIPMGSGASATKSDLLVFKEEEHYVQIDPYDLMMNRIAEQQKKSSSDFAVKLKVQATPSITAFIEIDKETGNVLSGQGEGTITIDVNPSRNIFNLGGDYNISSGSYHFNAMNLAQRDFSIQDGSSVRFNGDVMDSDLDIEAMYTTKTSLSNLIADSTSVASRRTVECIINISDKLRNPSISFDINVPDLDPTTSSLVESALNTDDKIQKQFLYLLIANSFLPDEQSGIASNNSNVLYSNVAQMMANQLNNIMEKLDIPLDLGLTYQSDDRGQNIFDVAVSTQLFNNRVIVNGTVGSRQYAHSSSNDEMVGDLDIEVKLDQSGQVRFNLFSHSADDYTNYLDNTQRNGVGVTYQKEFNKFKEFFRDLFVSKKRRDRINAKIEEMEDHEHEHEHPELEEPEQVVIKIEKE